MSPFCKIKGWSSHFWENQPFSFCDMRVHCQRRLKSKETDISTKFKTLACPESQNLVILMWEKVYMRKLYGVKAKDFWFKNQYFPSSACCSYLCCRSPRIYYDLVAGMWHLKCSSISLALIRSPTQKVGIELVPKLQ